MGAAREKTQADFDLERFIDMFDEALTSKDERVVNALRSLMMMVILTKPESRNDLGDVGPLRQIFDDLHHLNRRMHSMEDNLRKLELQRLKELEAYEKRSDVWPYNNITLSEEQYQKYKLAMNAMSDKTKL